MDDDVRLKKCFIDGMLEGMATVLFCVVLVIALLWMMFAAPESKAKMVCEPCVVMEVD